MTEGARTAIAVAVAVAVLSAASQAAIPVGTVPITLQTLAVTLAGAILGPLGGAVAVLFWLTLAAAGLPLLADGAGGLAAFSGPTAGYLFAFPFAAAAVGLLAERGWDGSRPLLALGAMLTGNAICLLLGWAWLAAEVGAGPAWMAGVLPFLPGALIKSGLGALILRVAPYFEIAGPLDRTDGSRGD